MANSTNHGGLEGADAAPTGYLHAPAPQPQAWSAKVGKDGRLVIPAAARAQMLLGPEGKVTLLVKDGELRVISPLAAMRRVQEILKPFRSETHSVVDEFIAERRLEQLREDQK